MTDDWQAMQIVVHGPGEYELRDHSGTSIYGPAAVPYERDLKRFMAEAMLAEYQANGVSERLMRLVVVMVGETYEVVE